MTLIAPPLATTRAGRAHLFYVGAALAIAAAVAIGFAPTYYLRGYFHPQRLPLLLKLHGFVFTSWIALLVLQTSLVAATRTRLHRRLGVIGGIVAALVVVLATIAALVSVRRDAASGSTDALGFLAIPFGDMLVFGVLVAAAFYYRRRSDVHKRLMLLATTALLGAAFARWPLARRPVRWLFRGVGSVRRRRLAARPGLAAAAAPGERLGRAVRPPVAAAAAGDRRHRRLARGRARAGGAVSGDSRAAA